MPKRLIPFDLIRDSLRARARSRGLHPTDIATALGNYPSAAHIGRYFAGQQNMGSPAVSRIAKLLGLTIHPEEIVK